MNLLFPENIDESTVQRYIERQAEESGKGKDEPLFRGSHALSA
jgi:hypothetical protein